MSKTRIVALGTDHSGFNDHQEIMSYIKSADPTIDVVHYGCHSTQSMDYPDVAVTVAEAVASGKVDFGILICGTGIGVSLAANKVPGVRAALCHDVTTAKLARQHNNANILCAGIRTSGLLEIEEMIHAFLNEPFTYDERHQRRINKIHDTENKYFKEVSKM